MREREKERERERERERDRQTDRQNVPLSGHSPVTRMFARL